MTRSRDVQRSHGRGGGTGCMNVSAGSVSRYSNATAVELMSLNPWGRLHSDWSTATKMVHMTSQ